MKIDDFISTVKEELQIEEDFNLDTRFDSLDIWDSVARLVMISLVDESFQIQLKADDFRSIITLQDLINTVGNEHFVA